MVRLPPPSEIAGAARARARRAERARASQAEREIEHQRVQTLVRDELMPRQQSEWRPAHAWQVEPEPVFEDAAPASPATFNEEYRALREAHAREASAEAARLGEELDADLDQAEAALAAFDASPAGAWHAKRREPAAELRDIRRQLDEMDERSSKAAAEVAVETEFQQIIGAGPLTDEERARLAAELGDGDVLALDDDDQVSAAIEALEELDDAAAVVSLSDHEKAVRRRLQDWIAEHA